MAYKIAVASTDGIHVNAHFGNTSSFLIIAVDDDKNYTIEEERSLADLDLGKKALGNDPCSIKKKSCGIDPGDHAGRSESSEDGRCDNGNGGSCGGHGGHGGHSDTLTQARIELIADCRCVLCQKAGAGAERQLGKKAITTFQIKYEIKEALEKIIQYYAKTDNHISLRKSLIRE